MFTLKPQVWIVLSFLGYYASLGISMPLLPTWLEVSQYDVEIISIFIASSYIFRFIGSIFVSSFANSSLVLINTMRVFALICMLSIVAAATFVANIYLLFLFFAIFSLIHGSGPTISDSLAGMWSRQINLDYGKTRITGSIAFALAATVSGYLVDLWGQKAIIWILFGFLCFYFLLQLPQPKPMPEDKKLHGNKIESVSYKEIFKNKKIVVFLIITSLIQGSHATYYLYSIIYWIKEGISPTITTLLWAASVGAEIVLFYFSSKLFKNRRNSTLLYLSTTAAIARWVLFPSVTFLPLIFIIQTLHALTYALTHFVSIRYINSFDQAYTVKLTALYSGISNAVAIALLMIVAGYIYPVNHYFAFYAMALLLIPIYFLLSIKAFSLNGSNKVNS